MRTVRDFKKFVLTEIGVGSIANFTALSPGHYRFWAKLNRLGARNMREQPPETVPDIDATVELSDSEWVELETEFLCLEDERYA